MRITCVDSITSPFPAARCKDFEAPSSGHEAFSMSIGVPDYMHGVAPAQRNMLPGYDSGVLCLLIAVFLLLSYNFRHYSTFIKNFSIDLLSVRRTERTFTVRTVSELEIQVSIVLVACLCEGIIIDAVLSHSSAAIPLSTFALISALTVVAGLYYLWQLAAYRLVGYVFTDRLTARQWLKGFNASQALLGALLVLPALIVLFNPEQSGWVMWLGIIFYVLARLIFLLKGFRLFYDNFGSLLYFILYLCSLEIVPLVLIFRGIAHFSGQY